MTEKAITDKNYIALIERLRQERMRLGFTQTELAQRMDVGRQSLVSWEFFHSYIPAQQLFKMLKILDLSLEVVDNQREV